MLHHLLFVASEAQIERTKVALKRLGATPLAETSAGAEAFRLEHAVLDKLVLKVYLLLRGCRSRRQRSREWPNAIVAPPRNRRGKSPRPAQQRYAVEPRYVGAQLPDAEQPEEHPERNSD